MMKTVIFGAGNLRSVLTFKLSQTREVICFLDNNPQKWGTSVDGIPVLGNASVLSDLIYDEIVIASTMRFDEIKRGLLDAGISEDRLNQEIQARLLNEIQARVAFLQSFAEMHKNVDGEYAVAEGSVFQGMFSREINLCFPERTLYLFDTFDGFDGRDVEVELKEGFSNVKTGYYNETSEAAVLAKLPHKEKAIIRKGYFPATTSGLENERFLFVSLDFDLYNPVLSGLRFFYPRMMRGGEHFSA